MEVGVQLGGWLASGVEGAGGGRVDVAIEGADVEAPSGGHGTPAII